MTFKTLVTTAILTLAPGLALAEGCRDHEQAMSCAEGSTWDAASGTCVDVTTTS